MTCPQSKSKQSPGSLDQGLPAQPTLLWTELDTSKSLMLPDMKQCSSVNVNRDFPHLKGAHRTESLKVTLIPDNSSTGSFTYNSMQKPSSEKILIFNCSFSSTREECASSCTISRCSHPPPTHYNPKNTFPFKCHLQPQHRNIHYSPIPAPI